MPEVGIKCKSFVKISGVYTVVDDLSDETINPTYEEAVGPVRGSRVSESEPTLGQLEVNIKVRKDTASAVWRYLFQQYLAKGACDFLFLGQGAAAYANGAFDVANTTGNTVGFAFTGKLHTFTEQRNMNDVLFNDATVKPSFNSNLTIPEVDGGTITYNVPSSWTA